MVYLDYELDPTSTSELDDAKVLGATVTDLTVRFFWGNVYFRIDNAVFDATWGWIPVLDFAIQLRDIAGGIMEAGADKLEFTENDEYIQFRRTDQEVEVSATYTESRARVSVHELRDASNGFLSRVLDDIESRWPACHGNQAFETLRDLVRCKDWPQIRRVWR